ncbi:hypothetical protein PTSG_04184 [Salpingoeca rosetta]|uniref:SH2 domain-containing protein n=1 Tax=Salpingoeca rosetta (strain ATCC 50818 / BSB-021) TaxID=946362 RepID=F2U6U5_SALR5|nr:uncharacterized protein PTSG_04184 [Salpingoeca rosetta]EGD83577.1 hypothetical protein PTSG_04184 [Salpingoeca rosetta]|eukprot:XP_004995081.1 hypothetical protein PTSG_04184 [Salpingoeca rosetta]
MSFLETVLQDMFVDPEILEELSKDQREILFELMREEQIRRWKSREHSDLWKLQAKKKKPARIQWASTAVIWDDVDAEKKAAEAAKRLEQIERERAAKEEEEDQQEAKILAEIELQNEVAKRTADAERRTEELRRREEEEKKRLEEEAIRERQAAIEREQYLSLKEARLAAEKEAAQRKAREEAARKLEEQRRAEEERLAEERRRAEEEAKKHAESKQQEIYESMREVRERSRRQKEEEEKRMDAIFMEQQQRAKQADEEKRKAVQLARRYTREKAAQDAAGTILKRIQSKKEAAPAKPPLAPRGGSMARAPSLNKRPPPLPPQLSQDMSRLKVAPGNPDSRPSRPTDTNSIVQWFQQDQLPRGTGRDAVGRWLPWFHGIISRTDAEQLLRGQPCGAFLLRVSTRIWGYTLSFVDTDRFKHFLVDVSDGEYKVFGSQSSRSHKDLATLIAFHQSRPVSKTGTKLTLAVGNKMGNPSVNMLLS